MSERTIVYGDVVSHKQRRQLQKSKAADELLLWLGNPQLYSPDENVCQVFVDLDSPRFAQADFLVSLVTGGQNVRVIGKVDHLDQAEIGKVTRLGVSEVLTSEQCLGRLDTLLNKLESVGPDDKSSKTGSFGLEAIVGYSASMNEIRSAISALSQVDFPSALILGTTGTGKGLIAKILHHTGVRRHQNMVEVNCSAIPDDLFESELFGHARGAFTDAKSEKMGLFEYAANGTIFLDEVGNLSASAQAKLLKVLEDKKLRRVGDIEERDIDVRVLAATNLDLERAISEGIFREDLYYRLSLLTLQLRPLNQHPEDVVDLVRHYLKHYSAIYRKSGLKLTESAINEMTAYHWPGNVRELCNVIERAVLLTQTKTIGVKDIKGTMKKGRLTIADRQQIIVDVPPQGITLDQAEQSIVRQVLNMFKWNKTETAKFLKISRPRLRRIINAGQMEQDRRLS